jgi:hypothetical protein
MTRTRALLLFLAATASGGCDGSDALGGFIIVALLGMIAVRLFRGRGGVASSGDAQMPRTSADCEPIVDQVRRAAGNSTNGPTTSDKQKFVSEQLHAHQRAYLRYEVGLLAVEYNLDPEPVRRLLNGDEVRFAAPTLVLFNDAWMWRRGELEPMVQAAAGPLGLVIAPGSVTIDERACDACRDWARAEAKRLVAPLVQGAEP